MGFSFTREIEFCFAVFGSEGTCSCVLLWLHYGHSQRYFKILPQQIVVFSQGL